MDNERFLDEVVALMPRLLGPPTRAAAKEVDRLLHEDFSEIGAWAGAGAASQRSPGERRSLA
jgi:hypothetical protein